MPWPATPRETGPGRNGGGFSFWRCARVNRIPCGVSNQDESCILYVLTFLSSQGPRVLTTTRNGQPPCEVPCQWRGNLQDRTSDWFSAGNEFE